MYDILFTKHAEKQFLKLPVTIQQRVRATLERARVRPQRHFERLVGDTAYKLRAGNYRIIADIYADKLIILVIEVGHRSSVYKR